MSRYVVVESSVAVKWFKRDGEQGVDEALQLLHDHRDQTIQLAAPCHLRLEVLNALRHGGLGATELDAAAQTLGDFAIEWAALDTALSREVASVSAELGLTVYDAAFVALAMRLDAELVTSDRALAQAATCRVRLLG